MSWLRPSCSRASSACRRARGHLRRVAASLLLLGVLLSPLAERRVLAATLTAGDLVVLGWSAVSDAITFATLVDLPSGTVITITDKGWDQATNAFTTSSTGDGEVTWTTSTSIPAGTVLRLFLGGTDAPTTLTNLTTSADLSGDIAVSAYTVLDPVILSGDGVFLYQDASATPYFLFGLNNSGGTVDASNWNTSIGATLRDSMLPNGALDIPLNIDLNPGEELLLVCTTATSQSMDISFECEE